MTEWRDVRLGGLLQVKHGFAFRGKHFAKTGTLIVLTPGNFHERGGFKPKNGIEKYYDGPVPEGYLLPAGQVVIAMTEQAAGLLGSSAVIPADDVYLHNQRIGLLLVNPEAASRRYVYYLFNSQEVRSQIAASASGAKVRHTAPERIHDVRVRVPNLPVQHRIADVLTAFDELIRNYRRKIEILEDAARSLYREWFVRYRFPGHGSAKVVESSFGTIPDGWSVEPFSALGKYLNGFAFKPVHWQSEGVPIIKIKELKNGVTPSTPRYPGDDIREKYRVVAGDLLFSWSGDLNAYLWAGPSGWLNQHLFRVSEGRGVPRSWLFLTLCDRMHEFRLRSQGTTMKHIQRSALDQVHAIRPTAAVLSAFDERVSPFWDLLVDLRLQSAALLAARDLLLPKLVAGKIDVGALGVDDVFGWAELASIGDR